VGKSKGRRSVEEEGGFYFITTNLDVVDNGGEEGTKEHPGGYTSDEGNERLGLSHNGTSTRQTTTKSYY
jgi:hypothetical protein